ncbi:MAG: methyltransferase domain-containing protein [Candidatus Aenigmarchaeota archaeon]|nr:methyltransferase domain-containing protein [Candidatus Aenigmarchaeota archaeon]
MSSIFKKTVESFGYEWQKFPILYPVYESEFLEWIKPIKQDFFKDKLVLDAGCGGGRHSYFAAKYGTKKVIAMDISKGAIKAAYKLLKNFKNVNVICGNICNPPFKQKFDFIYSIGVLHHLPDPEKGFKNLVKLLKPNATIFIWVYGKENNFVFVNMIDPIRRYLTSRLPPNIQYIISFFLGGLLHLTTKIYNILKFLPYRDYFLSISSHPFKFKHLTSFDFISAPSVKFVRKNEIRKWFDDANFKNISILWRNRNSWKGIGTK